MILFLFFVFLFLTRLDFLEKKFWKVFDVSYLFFWAFVSCNFLAWHDTRSSSFILRLSKSWITSLYCFEKFSFMSLFVLSRVRTMCQTKIIFVLTFESCLDRTFSFVVSFSNFCWFLDASRRRLHDLKRSSMWRVVETICVSLSTWMIECNFERFSRLNRHSSRCWWRKSCLSSWLYMRTFDHQSEQDRNNRREKALLKTMLCHRMRVEFFIWSWHHRNSNASWFRNIISISSSTMRKSYWLSNKIEVVRLNRHSHTNIQFFISFSRSISHSTFESFQMFRWVNVLFNSCFCELVRSIFDFSSIDDWVRSKSMIQLFMFHISTSHTISRSRCCVCFFKTHVVRISFFV